MVPVTLCITTGTVLEEQFNSRIRELQFLNRQLTLLYKMFLKSYLQSQCTVSFVFNFYNFTHFPSDLKQFQAPFILNLSKAVSYVCNKNEIRCTKCAFHLEICLILKQFCTQKKLANPSINNRQASSFFCFEKKYLPNAYFPSLMLKFPANAGSATTIKILFCSRTSYNQNNTISTLFRLVSFTQKYVFMVYTYLRTY